MLVRDIRKTYVTSCPAYSLWFERFMMGMHKYMGDEVRQDKAVTLEVVHKTIEGLEEDFLRAKTDIIRGDLCGMEVFVLSSFLAALREEEILKISLSETRDYFAEARSKAKHDHGVFPLRERFKGENGEGYHFVAVTPEINSAFTGGRILPYFSHMGYKNLFMVDFYFIL